MLYRFLVLALVALSPGETSRLEDEDVRKLMEEAKKDVERFTDAIDSRYRKATIRTATSEVAIDGYLRDLKKSAETMRDRFKEDYAAGREVLSFLRQASAIEKRSAQGGGLFGAEKEWPRLRGTLERLSRVYGVDWESDPVSWSALRMNDGALREELEKLSSTAKTFKKSLESALEHTSSVRSADRKSVVSAVERISSAANDLEDALEDPPEASKELGKLTTAFDEVRSFLDEHGLAKAVGSTFRSLETDVATVRNAFH